MKGFGGGQVCSFFKFCLYGKTGLIFKHDAMIINQQLEFSGTRVKYLDHEKRAYKHEIWSYRMYLKKPLIIAHSEVSRATRCLKVVRSLFSTCILCLCEAKALARSCVHAGSSEPSPHADVIRTIISCADQFIVLIFHCGLFLFFCNSVCNLNS